MGITAKLSGDLLRKEKCLRNKDLIIIVSDNLHYGTEVSETNQSSHFENLAALLSSKVYT